MPARLILADAIQTYSKLELRFLLAVASRFPPDAVLHAAHDRQPPAPLQIALDLRIVDKRSVYKFHEDQLGDRADQEAVLLQRLAAQAYSKLSMPLPPPRVPSFCPRCGRDTVDEYPAQKRRRPDRYCRACGWSSVPEHEKRG